MHALNLLFKTDFNLTSVTLYPLRKNAATCKIKQITKAKMEVSELSSRAQILALSFNNVMTHFYADSKLLQLGASLSCKNAIDLHYDCFSSSLF